MRNGERSSRTLSNAFNAMLDAPERRMKVSTKISGQERILRVQDTGRGVDLEKAEDLFEPFVRTMETDQERMRLGYGGTGLGLTIVRLLTERIGCLARFVEPEQAFELHSRSNGRRRKHKDEDTIFDDETRQREKFLKDIEFAGLSSETFDVGVLVDQEFKDAFDGMRERQTAFRESGAWEQDGTNPRTTWTCSWSISIFSTLRASQTPTKWHTWLAASPHAVSSWS